MEVGGLVIRSCAYTFPLGVVVVVAGVEKEREAKVLMLEELEHQVADTDNADIDNREVG